MAMIAVALSTTASYGSDVSDLFRTDSKYSERVEVPFSCSSITLPTGEKGVLAAVLIPASLSPDHQQVRYWLGTLMDKDEAVSDGNGFVQEAEWCEWKARGKVVRSGVKLRVGAGKMSLDGEEWFGTRIYVPKAGVHLETKIGDTLYVAEWGTIEVNVGGRPEKRHVARLVPQK